MAVSWLRPAILFFPGLLGGMRVAAPAAILGAILAEFGSGARLGLGHSCSGLGWGDPARIWGSGSTATQCQRRLTACVRRSGRRAAASLPAATSARRGIEPRAGERSSRAPASVIECWAPWRCRFRHGGGILKAWTILASDRAQPVGRVAVPGQRTGRAGCAAGIVQASASTPPLPAPPSIIALAVALVARDQRNVWRGLKHDAAAAAVFL